jgi:hypothetical protein
VQVWIPSIIHRSFFIFESSSHLPCHRTTHTLPPCPMAQRELTRQLREAARPPWQLDSDTDVCMRCCQTFRFDVRRHHCRSRCCPFASCIRTLHTALHLRHAHSSHHGRCCGLIYCLKCTPESRPMVSLGYAEPVRMCIACYAGDGRDGVKCSAAAAAMCSCRRRS